MTEIAGAGRWRVVWGPDQANEDSDEWTVVFRLDDLGRDAEGPQVLVTSTSLTEYDSYDPEADATCSEDTRFLFQIRAPDGDLIALASKQAPHSWHNRAIDIADARDRAMRIIQEVAENPGYWTTWDGTAAFSGVAEPGPSVPDWLEAPVQAVVSLRRQFRGKAREQWAIVQRASGLGVEHGDPERREWQQTDAGPFSSVADALVATPAMGRLHRDVINDFTVSPGAALDEHSFAALLDLCPDEGTSDPGSWDEADVAVSDWPGLGSQRWPGELPLLVRLASVNGYAIAGILHDGSCFAVLADEDEIYPLQAVATATTHAYPGISMVGWDGGCELRLVAPGLACNWLWGDEIDSGENGYYAISFPGSSGPDVIAAIVADWLTIISFDFWAALVLEPLDPDGTLTDQERERWEDSLPVVLYPRLEVPPEARDLIREALTQRSESYKYAREARANPRGHAAQAMLRSIQPDLHDGSWIGRL